MQGCKYIYNVCMIIDCGWRDNQLVWLDQDFGLDYRLLEYWEFLLWKLSGGIKTYFRKRCSKHCIKTDFCTMASHPFSFWFWFRVHWGKPKQYPWFSNPWISAESQPRCPGNNPSPLDYPNSKTLVIPANHKTQGKLYQSPPAKLFQVIPPTLC